MQILSRHNIHLAFVGGGWGVKNKIYKICKINNLVYNTYGGKTFYYIFVDYRKTNCLFITSYKQLEINVLYFKIQ